MTWSATAVALTAVGLTLVLAVAAVILWRCCFRRRSERSFGSYASMSQSFLERSHASNSGSRSRHQQPKSSMSERSSVSLGQHAAREVEVACYVAPENALADGLLSLSRRPPHGYQPDGGVYNRNNSGEQRETQLLDRRRPAEDEFIGKCTIQRCVAALTTVQSGQSSMETHSRTALLLRFATRVLRDKSSLFLSGDDFTATNDSLKEVVWLQTAVSTAVAINRTLDTMTLGSPNWRHQLEQEVDLQIERLSVLLEQVRYTDSRAVWGLRDRRQRLHTAALLSYELQEEDYAVTDMFPTILPLLRCALGLVTSYGDGVTMPIEQPTWFDPCLLLQIPAGGVQPGDTVAQIGLTDVGVTLFAGNNSESEEECVRRAALWSNLRHPNVLALEAASYVGTPVMVYAHGTPLHDVVRAERRPGSRETKWTRILEAALGLQYLQSRDVVFGALTPDGIVVTGVSGVNDKHERTKSDHIACKLKCSRVVSLRSPRIPDRLSARDMRWLSPERLDGGSVSFEADMFSFGLCILHALTGENLWIDPSGVEIGAYRGVSSDIATSAKKISKEDRNELVHRAVLSLESDTRDLVLKMIAREAKERASIASVVAQLQRLADAETKRNNDASRPSKENTARSTTMPVTSIRLGYGLTLDAAMSEIQLSSVQSSIGDTESLEAMQTSVLERLDRFVASLKTHSDGCISSDAGDILVEMASRLLNSSRQYFGSSVASSSSFLSWMSTSHGASNGTSMAIRRQASDTYKSLHLQLDKILLLLDPIHQQDPVHSDWRRTWDALQANDSHTIEMEASPDRQQSDRIAEEELIVLQFEVQNRAASYSQDALAEMHSTIARLEQHIGPRPLPSWFLPAYEVVFDAVDAFAEGAFGSVHRGRWLDSSVVIKKVFASGSDPDKESKNDQTVFVREADIWSSLKHENVVQLYGACHLRGQRFFVCEFVACGTLDAYLSSQRALQRNNQAPDTADSQPVNVWRLLYGVGCGLKFLHQHGIAHGDLKCNNVLIGQDETPKLTDFGLSESGKGKHHPVGGDLDGDAESEDKPVGALGAYRWKAPEVLRAEANTSCEADVFSFGMVIIEAMTGDVPWGRDLPDPAVKYHAMNGQLPNRPRRITRGGVDTVIGFARDDAGNGDEFADDEWELVLSMCRLDPSSRLPLHEAVSCILQFSLRR